MIRESFTINRQLEFFSESELVKQLGYSREWWPAVLVAELVDNALDHCEESGILPSISVTVADDSITVTDNGLGIPPEVVTSMVDFDSRTSSRMCYASPTRGRQGNAGKCLLALPYVIDGTQGCVEIDAAGVSHRIVTTMDAIARMPVVEHIAEAGKVQIGTSTKVALPCQMGQRGVGRIVSLLAEYAAFNAHAEFKLDYFGDRSIHQRSTQTITKWTARNPDPAHWYDLPTFENLLAASIQLDRQRGQSRTVREFVRQFAGLKRSDTLKDVLDATGFSRCELSSLVTAHGIDSEQATSLLNAMQAATEPPKPAKLGTIGCAHIEATWGHPCEYKRVLGTNGGGLPFIVEAAFCERGDDGCQELFTGVNFSVDVRSPAYEHTWNLLADCRVEDDAPVNVLLHITSPRVEYTNRGKTSISTCAKFEEAIELALKLVTKAYTARMKAAERDANRAPPKPAKSKDSTLKDAIFTVMAESIATVSQGNTCDFSARNHFYAVRPLVQQFTDKKLSQSYLDRIIDEWEATNGIIERRTRDPRGFLLEPHTGTQIPLGTRQVDDYQIPLHLYHTVIYVEKKGLLSNFQFGQIAEKYDAAIICAEGYAVRAAQQLMQSARNGHSMKIFVFHDADPAGYGIAKAIGENSGAHKFDFEIIDAGLRIEEALEMGLQTETFTRKKALPKAIKFNARELELFEGNKRRIIRKNGKPGWQWTGCRRVELNALAANPQQFVDWVESKLERHGAAKKLVPSPETLQARVASHYQTERRERIRTAVMSVLNIGAIVNSIDAKLPKPEFTGVADSLKQWADKLEPVTWSKICESIANEKLSELQQQIEIAAKELAQ